MMASVFPFEKNRYFPGKRMRAADFTRELAYMDQKFALLQRWTLGRGRLFGLQVQRADEETLLVSPGVALDGQGRYLAVDQPVLCRLDSLEGFDALEGESALLVLSYREENREPVYLTAGQDALKQEDTVVAERYAFSLRTPGAAGDSLLDQLLVRDTLYQDPALWVRQMVPQVISARHPVSLRLVVDNLSQEQREIWLHYTPRLSGFSLPSGGLEGQFFLPPGRTALELRMIPESPAGTAVLELGTEDFTLSAGDSVYRLAACCRQELTVTAGDPAEVLARRCRDISLEQACAESQDGVPVALVQLFRYQDKVLLDRVTDLPGAPRASAPAVERWLEACRAFFPPAEQDFSGRPAPARPDPPPRQMTTGVVTLTAERHLDKDRVVRSGEMVHNLGLGTVYVEFGVEQVYPDAGPGQNRTDLLLGDASLFPQPGGSFGGGVRHGVLVHPDRGTFEIALQIPEKQLWNTLQLRWFAWRPQEQVDPDTRTSHLIGLEPSVVYAAPGAVIHFAPVFAGEPLPCQFFVPGRQDGCVTRDGVYTAPQREGLYQVCARVQEGAQAKVSAFVIVRTGTEEDGDGS